MKTFAIVIATSMMLVALFVGYVCATQVGYGWFDENMSGYLGMLIISSFVAVAISTGHLIGVCDDGTSDQDYAIERMHLALVNVLGRYKDGTPMESLLEYAAQAAIVAERAFPELKRHSGVNVI
jgi:hypothetical protein